ncbi:MAG: hypothetical protein MUE85_18405 [Microscillaceae bacterium]|jgi:hypothetical protein|nr:hypothetical protein [Microscillaceae bacterium]
MKIENNQISKAQMEVWEWKEKAYQQIANLPDEDQIPYIRQKVQEKIALIKSLQAQKH